MTSQTGQMLLLAGAAIMLLWGLHALAWNVVVRLTAAVSRLPELWGSRGGGRAWARLRPLKAGLRAKAPRIYVFLAARFDPERFTGMPLTLFILGAFYVAALLCGLTEEVLEAGTVLRFDQTINAAFGPWRVRPLISIFLWITALGAGSALTAVATTATAFLWSGRRPTLILPLWIAFLGAQATTWSSKYVIARHRPEFIEAVSETSPSFPSGHATAAMALYGFLAYALARDLTGRRERFEVVYWTGVLIAAIGFSRIFLSLHYTTDVAAGLMVGTFWLLAGFAMAEWRRGIRAPGRRQLAIPHTDDDA